MKHKQRIFGKKKLQKKTIIKIRSGKVEMREGKVKVRGIVRKVKREKDRTRH